MSRITHYRVQWRDTAGCDRNEARAFNQAQAASVGASLTHGLALRHARALVARWNDASARHNGPRYSLDSTRHA